MKKSADQVARLVEIDALLDGHRANIRVINSDLANPDRIHREIERMQAVIAKYQREIAQMQERLSSGPELIEYHQAEIQRLKKERVQVSSAAAIQKLLALQAEINSLHEEEA